jgi:hypothetical protein
MESGHEIRTGSACAVGADATRNCEFTADSRHSHSIIRSDDNLLISQCKSFLRTAKNRLTDPSEICALDFKRNFAELESARFQRLSRSIGRFSLTAADQAMPAVPKKDRHEARPVPINISTLIMSRPFDSNGVRRDFTSSRTARRSCSARAR